MRLRGSRGTAGQFQQCCGELREAEVTVKVAALVTLRRVVPCW